MRIAVALVVPFACAWARRQESIILRAGVALSGAQATTATHMGVLHPDRVRLLAVAQVPPLNRLFRCVGQRFRFIPPEIAGMTLGYGIFIRSDCWGDQRLLVHELAHVLQYERFGGFRAFLTQYLCECINPGYPRGELEQEAKRAEAAYCVR